MDCGPQNSVWVVSSYGQELREREDGCKGCLRQVAEGSKALYLINALSPARGK